MSKSGGVKQEKLPPQDEDKGLAGAQKFLARPPPQFGVQRTNASGTPLLAPILNQSTSVAEPIPPQSGFDRDSAKGKFTWVTISDDKNVPCIFRNKDKYVSIRMAEISVLGELLNLLPCELYESVRLTSYYVTAAEAKLLTYINSWHCDGFYGSKPFTLLDGVISLNDLKKFYDFLLLAFRVLHSGGKNMDNEFRHSGFVRINLEGNENMLPYAVLDGGDSDEKGVPLFYLDGNIDIFKNKIQSLGGWPLAYLKVCCKVRGVRNDLISMPSLQIVTLSSLQAVFHKNATFTDKCWPPPKPKSLLPKHSLLGVMNSALLQVPSYRWTRFESNKTFPNFTKPTITSTTNTPTATMSAVVMNPKNGIPALTLSSNGVPTKLSNTQSSSSTVTGSIKNQDRNSSY